MRNKHVQRAVERKPRFHIQRTGLIEYEAIAASAIVRHTVQKVGQNQNLRYDG